MRDLEMNFVGYAPSSDPLAPPEIVYVPMGEVAPTRERIGLRYKAIAVFGVLGTGVGVYAVVSLALQVLLGIRI